MMTGLAKKEKPRKYVVWSVQRRERGRVPEEALVQRDGVGL